MKINNSDTSIRTRLTIAGTGIALAGVLAACGSSGGGFTLAATPSTTAPPPTTSSASAPAPTTSAATGVSAAGTSGSATAGASAHAVAQCAESQLRASIDPRHVPGTGTPGADGKQLKAVIVDFENTSSTTCTLYGYPGAATETAANVQVQQATRTLRGPLGGLPSGQHAPSTVTLKPHAYAAAFIEGADQQQHGAAQAGCDSTTPKLLVTPPNTRTPVPFRVSWGLCYSLEVHPVRALATPPSS